jgi:threonine/homoserine/homoserine lactone efflux protein
MLNESVIAVLSMIGLVHLVALVSPGPDFAMILRSSIQHGKQYALLSALGLTCGVAFHVTYCMLGLNLLINSLPYFIYVVAAFGSVYFFYQGYKSIAFAIKTKNQEISLATFNHTNATASNENMTWKAISTGFFTNALNPKAFVYFLSFFAVAIAKIKTPYLSIAVSVEVILLTWLWFTFLSLIVSSDRFLKIMHKYNFVTNVSIGVVFILFSISMILYTYFN